MTSDHKGSGGQRWQQIERLCHAALEREASQRASFLADACAGDETLRQEVESLLAHDRTADGFLSAPALDVAARVQVADARPTMAGR